MIWSLECLYLKMIYLMKQAQTQNLKLILRQTREETETEEEKGAEIGAEIEIETGN